MKNLLKTIIFLLLLILSINYLNRVFIPNFTTYNIFPEYEKLSKNSIDVLFLGDSNIYSDISPLEMYNDYGFTSFDYASPASTAYLNFFMLKEALKTQHPKIVMMDVTTIFNQIESPEMRRMYTDLMPNDEIKLSLVNDSLYNYTFQDKISSFIPFFRYHSRWNKIKSLGRTKTNPNDLLNRGYIFNEAKRAGKHSDTYMDFTNVEATFKSDYLPQAIINIKNYLASQDIEFILVSMPDATAWSYDKTAKMVEWTATNQINYLDLNLMVKDLKLDLNTDSSENGMHLNILGAEKVSRYLGDYLSSKYELPDHRHDPSYQDWNNDYQSYLQIKAQNIAELNQN